MKFRDGMWLVKSGIRVEYAEDIHRVTSNDGKSVRLLCPTRHIKSRGDTLNIGTITIDLESVFDDVISITSRHWLGAVDKGPHFPLFPDGQPKSPSSIFTPSKSPTEGAKLTCGNLIATISPNSNVFDIRFSGKETSNNHHQEKLLTSLLDRSVGFAYDPAPGSPQDLADMQHTKHYMFTQHTLSVGEQIYGLGERFTAFNKVGQSVTLYNSDGGTSSEQAYKNVPFYLSSRGYGVFIDQTESLDLEIGSERSCRLQTSVLGQKLKWYIIYGPTPKDVLRKYTILTGKAGSLPSWSFGLWLSTSFTTDYDEKTVMSFVKGMEDRDIPVHTFHYDCFWMREFQWCDFEFYKEHFPEPKAMISRIKANGLKICVWINSYIGQTSSTFEEAAKAGYLLKRKNGDVWQWDLWQSGMGIVDFTNPDARKWYVEKLEQLFEIGVDAIKTDFGERIPDDDVEWFDKSVDPKKMRSYYALLYNQVVYEALEKKYGKGQAVLFARTATAGAQRFPLHWGGDCESTFEAMAESVRGGLSLGVSGFSFWSVDIGGFEGTPSPEVYKRWLAFGLTCSHSRLHGSNSFRVPWAIDEESSTVLKVFHELKCRLMPYLYGQAKKSIESGVPLSLRAMFFEFPQDPTSWYLDRQYMLGDSILVAPVFTANGDVEFYLPAGKWTNWFTQEVVEGPVWRIENHTFMTMPVYIRERSVLVMGKSGEKRVVYDYTSNVDLHVFQPTEQPAEVDIINAEGACLGTVGVAYKDGSLAVSFSESMKERNDWNLILNGKAKGDLKQYETVKS